MEADERASRIRSFVLGGLVGASAALATARRRRKAPSRRTPAGLRAFEEAPCYRELVASDESSTQRS